MTGSPLWHGDELLAATGGAPSGGAFGEITGISIDTRTLAPGDLFVALKDQRDGHEFVAEAFRRGAAAALVAQSYPARPGDGPLVRVDDPLAALERLARAARARLAPEARVFGVTGSAGKTTTKEMLRTGLEAMAPARVHASAKSFNNHWGVPLTLALMPRDTLFAVLEIGMNHAGEITPLSGMARPHAAIITTVEAVHLEHFNAVEEIADAKAEIFAGLEPGGLAILNRDNPHYARLARAAHRKGAAISAFGRAEDADVQLVAATPGDVGQSLTIALDGVVIETAIGITGEHIAMNALAVIRALREAATGLSESQRAFAMGLYALRGLSAPPGRGARVRLSLPGGPALLIDESYNANPASMRAALAAMADVPRARFGRRVAVLGDMLELGPDGPAMHAALSEAIAAAEVDLVMTAGPLMRSLHDALPETCRGSWAETAAGIRETVLSAIRAGDVVMVKGSNGSKMGPLVEAIKTKYSGPDQQA